MIIGKYKRQRKSQMEIYKEMNKPLPSWHCNNTSLKNIRKIDVGYIFTTSYRYLDASRLCWKRTYFRVFI